MGVALGEMSHNRGTILEFFLVKVAPFKILKYSILLLLLPELIIIPCKSTILKGKP